MSEVVVGEIVSISIDDIAVDDANMRAGIWDRDEDDEKLINDVKENGVRDALVVRPAHPDTGVRFAVVAGSRRFHAAVEAGLDRVPCVIKTDLDDLSAMAESFAENVHKKDVSGLLKINQMGRMYEKLNDSATFTQKVNFLVKKTGFDDHSVREYLAIYLTPEIMELMKEPAERSAEIVELLKQSGLAGITKTLSIKKAAIIATELEGYPIGRIVEVAAHCLDKTPDQTRELVQMAKTYTKEPMEDIVARMYGIPKGRTWMIQFSSTIVQALDDACTRKHIDRKELIRKYVENGLREDGFL